MNPSTKKGGTVTMEDSDVPDSLDPGNTYYGWVQNFSRLYGRSLLTFKPAAGSDGLSVVPDLATGLGKASPDAKTWTYTLRSGIKFQDGTPVTSKDVKYAIERSNFAPEALSNGPTYFKAYLADDAKYQGPYKDKSPSGLASIATPDDHTIVFHLAKPFADFDYLATFSQTAPIEQSKDTGASYVNHILSTGPYMFQSYQDGKSATLVRNPQWVASTRPDPQGAAGQDHRQVQGERGHDRQQPARRQLDGGRRRYRCAAADPAEAAHPAEARRADRRPVRGRHVVHGDQPEGRAVQQHRLPRGRRVGASTRCRCSRRSAARSTVTWPARCCRRPSTATASSTCSRRPATSGDAAKAKAALAQCGKPGGFSANITARSDRPTEVAEATAIQQALKPVGINAHHQAVPLRQVLLELRRCARATCTSTSSA